MKYGFIYLWYDTWRKMYYIGCHWGTTDDGYICSSNRMRDAYRRRPQDFKRRIIKKIYTNRQDLLDEEHKWLQMIPNNELGKSYYNLRKNLWKCYIITEDDKQKISKTTKAAMQRPEVREKYLEGLKTRKFPKTEQAWKRRSEASKKLMEKRFPLDQRKPEPLKFGSEEYINNMKEICKKSWKTRPIEQKQQRASKISESLKSSKETRSKQVSEWKWWNNGTVNKRCKDCPGNDFILGKINRQKEKRTLTPEHKEKLRMAKLNKTHSDETKRKQAESIKLWWVSKTSHEIG